MSRVAALALLLSGLCAGAAVAQDGDAKRGRDISIRQCARCHVIGDYNRMGGIESTPSFQMLARHSDFDDRLRTFYERRPHPAFVRVPGVERWSKLPPYAAPLTITTEQIEDIVAFVRSLKSFRRKPRSRRR